MARESHTDRLPGLKPGAFQGRSRVLTSEPDHSELKANVITASEAGFPSDDLSEIVRLESGGWAPAAENMASSNPALWLDAWHDPVASIHTTSSCIRVADVTGDGDPKLLVADQNRTLRMYKGAHIFGRVLATNFNIHDHRYEFSFGAWTT